MKEKVQNQPVVGQMADCIVFRETVFGRDKANSIDKGDKLNGERANET